LVSLVVKKTQKGAYPARLGTFRPLAYRSRNGRGYVAGIFVTRYEFLYFEGINSVSYNKTSEQSFIINLINTDNESILSLAFVLSRAYK